MKKFYRFFRFAGVNTDMLNSIDQCYHILDHDVSLYVNDLALKIKPQRYHLSFHKSLKGCPNIFSDHMRTLLHDHLPPLDHIVIFHKPIDFNSQYQKVHIDVQSKPWAVNLVISQGNQSVMSWFKLREGYLGTLQKTCAGTPYQEFLPEQVEFLTEAYLDNKVSLVNIEQPHRIHVQAPRLCISLRFTTPNTFDQAKEWFVQHDSFKKNHAGLMGS